MRHATRYLAVHCFVAGLLLAALLLCAGCGGGPAAGSPALDRSTAAKPPPPPPPDPTPADPAIAYFATEKLSTYSLMVMNADGTNQRRLYSAGLGTQFHSSAWSADGEQLAFMNIGTDSIYTINLDGTGLFEVIHQSPLNGGIAWSPADVPFRGNRIAYCYWDGDLNIWLISPLGGEPEKLTSYDGYAVSPTWSPDATRMAYSCGILNPDGTWHHSILIHEFADGSTWEVPLGGALAAGANELGHLDWARHSDKLAFREARTTVIRKQTVTYTNLWVVDLSDPGNPLMLAGDGSSVFGSPSWSPDDSQLVYSKGDEIWKMNADGSNKALLLAPDGKQVLALSSPEWKR